LIDKLLSPSGRRAGEEEVKPDGDQALSPTLSQKERESE